MTASRKLTLVAGAIVLAAFGASAALAQTPDTRIIVIGAINNPAHLQPVTDGRDDAAPELPVVYENQTQNAPAQTQQMNAQQQSADHAQAQPASTGGANLGQTVKSQ